MCIDNVVVDGPAALNMIGNAYTTQFGNLLVSQPPFTATYGLPDSSSLLIMSVKDVEREIPYKIKKYVRFLDLAFDFGRTLRMSTNPDFIASAVLARSDSSDDLESLGEQSDVNDNKALSTLREHIERSSGWILSTISADSRVILRIPPLGCAHLFLIVCFRLVRRASSCGVWDSDADVAKDARSFMVSEDSCYSSELQQAMMLGVRILQILGAKNVMMNNTALNESIKQPEKEPVEFFRVLCFELSCANADRRCAARLAVKSLQECSEQFALLSESVLWEAVESPAGAPLPEMQLRYILKDAGTPEYFAHTIICEGPCWNDCLMLLWKLLEELSVKSAVVLAPKVIRACSAALETETESTILVSCIHFLLAENGADVGVLADETGAIKNLRTQAAIDGLIGLLSKQPVVAVAVMTQLPVDCIPSALAGLMNAILDNVQMDRLVYPVGVDCSYDYVAVLLPAADDGIGASSSRWPEPLSEQGGKGTARQHHTCQVHHSVIQGILTAISLYITHFRLEDNGDLPRGWRELGVAAVSMLNSIPPKLLLSLFRDNLILFGSSFVEGHREVYAKYCKWMSLECVIALLAVSGDFDLDFSLHLTWRVQELLCGPEILELKGNSLPRPTRIQIKKSDDRSPSELDHFLTAWKDVRLSPSHSVSQIIRTVCRAALQTSDTDGKVPDCLEGSVKLMQALLSASSSNEVLATLHDLSFCVSDTLARLAGGDLNVSVIKTESHESDIDSILNNASHSEADVTRLVKHVSAGCIEDIAETICRGNLSTMRQIISPTVLTRSNICLGSKMKLVDCLFAEESTTTPYLLQAAELSDALRVDGSGWELSAYLYFKTIQAFKSDESLESKQLQIWLQKAFVELLDYCWGQPDPYFSVQCCCHTAPTDNVLGTTLDRMIEIIVSDKMLAQEVTVSFWGNITGRMKKEFVHSGSDVKTVRILSLLLLAAYSAFPEAIGQLFLDGDIAQVSKPLYSRLLYTCYTSLWRCSDNGDEVDSALSVHFPEIGSCKQLLRFSPKFDTLTRQPQFLNRILVAFTHSPLCRQLKYAVDMLVLQHVIIACTRRIRGEKVKIPFNKDFESTASSLIVHVADCHPVLWIMMIPLFEQVLEQLGPGRNVDAYPFPQSTIDDITGLNSGSSAEHTRDHVLALTPAPYININDEAVPFIDCLQSVAKMLHCRRDTNEVKQMSENFVLPFIDEKISMSRFGKLLNEIDLLPAKFGTEVDGPNERVNTDDGFNEDWFKTKSTQNVGVHETDAAMYHTLEVCGLVASEPILKLFGINTFPVAS